MISRGTYCDFQNRHFPVWEGLWEAGPGQKGGSQEGVNWQSFSRHLTSLLQFCALVSALFGYHPTSQPPTPEDVPRTISVTTAPHCRLRLHSRSREALRSNDRQSCWRAGEHTVCIRKPSAQVGGMDAIQNEKKEHRVLCPRVPFWLCTSRESALGSKQALAKLREADGQGRPPAPAPMLDKLQDFTLQKQAVSRSTA